MATVHTFRITSSYNIFCGYTVSFDISFTSQGRRKQAAENGPASWTGSGAYVSIVMNGFVFFAQVITHHCLYMNLFGFQGWMVWTHNADIHYLSLRLTVTIKLCKVLFHVTDRLPTTCATGSMQNYLTGTGPKIGG